MEFTPDFKLRVYEILKNHPNIHDIMKALEENDDLSFRFLLDVVMDTIEVALRPRIIIDVGDMELWNGQVRYWLEVNSIYSELLENINSELDTALTEIIKPNNEENSHH